MQYLTSDGGGAEDSLNLSAPTRDFWHRRLAVRWAREYPGGHALAGRGNWRDAGQQPEGSQPYAVSAPLTQDGQRVEIDVTALVQRWWSGEPERGFYLDVRGSDFPLQWHGRWAAQEGDRPRLTLHTSTGTVALVAAANATWHKSSYRGGGSAATWRLAAQAQPAILRFGLPAARPALQRAVLSLTVKAFEGGSRGHRVEVYECDPPTLRWPAAPEHASRVQRGLAAAHADFRALQRSADPRLLRADDFRSPGPFDQGFTPPAERLVNPATGTTAAHATLAAGANLSLDARVEVSRGSGARGTPDRVYEELYGQYWLYLEDDFGTPLDTAIKIPAMGVQFGIWNSMGYWQQTTGNGGEPGTGLKVDRGAGQPFEYQGHSVRFLTGVSPTAADDDPYAGWFGIGIYAYHLDQVGPFPAGEAFANVVIRRGQWFCVDIQVRQNSLAGGADALGNRATAVADGVYAVWIDGVPVYRRTDFRWRRHAEFGVQGMWLDVYHGGVPPAPHRMRYRIDRVSVATTYLGPPAP